MTDEMKNFEFPSWETISTMNQAFLDREEYKGYSINIPVLEDSKYGLYMLIDCQNDSVVKMGSDVIRFAWCNRAGFAVASMTYKNCEAGYLLGCAFLINAANEMNNFFEEFLSKHTLDISSRIIKYEEENTEK